MNRKKIANHVKIIPSGLSWLNKSSLKLKVGLAIFLALVTVGLLESQINSYMLNGHSSTTLGIYKGSLPPSYEHPLGTDQYGRDNLALEFTGLRFSLTLGFFVGAMSISLATIVATVSAYKGGIWDSFLNSVTNSMLVIPSLPILIAIVAATRVDLFTMCLVLTAFSWSGASRRIRAQILSLKERAYVDLAKVTGLNSFEIMFREIIPNLIPFIAVGFTTAIIGAILAETGLRMIGLGPADIYSLGLLLNWALSSGTYIKGEYYILFAPIGILIMIFVSLNLINMGLEETFNPRLKKITGM